VREEYGEGEPPALVPREPQLAEARAALSSAEATLATAELDLSRTEVRAPFDGRVRTESAEVGQFLMRGGPVATVYGTDYAEVRLAIPDDQLGFLDLPSLRRTLTEPNRDQALPVRLATTLSGTEYTWEGFIARTEAEVDPKTRVIYSVARVKDPYSREEPGRPPLMVGMYVRAEIPGRKLENVKTIPRLALRGRDLVLVVDEENRIRRRQIRILRKDGERVLVESGLSVGERLCVTDLDRAVEGMKVNVEAAR
jgi:RND family efflux transporter MFP subunit